MFIVPCKQICTPVDATIVILEYTTSYVMFFRQMMCKEQNVVVQQLSEVMVSPSYRFLDEGPHVHVFKRLQKITDSLQE